MNLVVQMARPHLAPRAAAPGRALTSVIERACRLPAYLQPRCALPAFAG